MASNIAQIPNQGSDNTIIVVNQGGRRRQAAPYMRRGTTFKGHHFGHCSLFCIIFFGLLLITYGIVLTLYSNLAFLLLPAGICIIGFYIYLIRKAKKEYEALPLDHPDRLKYLGIDITQLPSTCVPPSNQAAAPPQGPPRPQAQKNETHEPYYPHSPSHSGQAPSEPPPGINPPPPPPSYDQYPPPPGYTPSQSPPPSGYYPLPCKTDEDPPPYSAV